MSELYREDPNTPQPEQTSPFDLFVAIPPRERWSLLKEVLFADKGLKELREQPHGLDLLVMNFVEINTQTGRPGKIVESRRITEAENMPEVFDLEYGKEYFAMLWPPLRTSYDKLGYDLHLLPKSSLHRIGVASRETPCYDPEDDVAEDLAQWFDYFYDGRQAAFRIFVANPKGVGIERLAPLVQVIPERIPSRRPDVQKTSEGQEQLLVEREKEKREPLHLGEMAEFTDKKPRLATDKIRDRLDVTEPMTPNNGVFRLEKRRPYLMRTQETISLSAHEIGLTSAFLEREDLTAFGDALVDAGYNGGLTYLVIPKRDMELRAGDEISYLLRINVPRTEMPYSGQWK